MVRDGAAAVLTPLNEIDAPKAEPRVGLGAAAGVGRHLRAERLLLLPARVLALLAVRPSVRQNGV